MGVVVGETIHNVNFETNTFDGLLSKFQFYENKYSNKGWISVSFTKKINTNPYFKHPFGYL